MIQTTVLDVTKPCRVEYTPPSHEAGERWPGPERPTKQLTLFDKRLVRPAISAKPNCREVRTSVEEESDEEEWFESRTQKS